MINLVLSLQSKLDSANKHVLEEIRKISDPFLKLQFKLAVSQEVNSLLLNKLSNMKRQCWANALYFCWTNYLIWNVSAGQMLCTPEGNT